MRWKTTVGLLILTVGIGTYVSLYELKRPTPEEQVELAKEVVRLPSEDITSVIVESPQANVSLQRRNDSWHLVSPLAVRADDALVQRLLNELNPLEAERVLEGSKATPLSLGEFGLAPPQAMLTAIAGSRTVTVLFGTPTAVGGNRYVTLADSSKVLTVSSRLFDALNHPLDAYRSRELLDVDTWSATQITVASPASSYALRKQAPAGRWQLLEPLMDEAEGAAVSSTLSKLRGLRAERFITDAPQVEQALAWGFDAPFAHITIAFDNKSTPLELFVGKPTTDNPEQRYAKRTDEPTIYAVTKDRVEALLQDPQTLRARTVLDFFANQATKVRVRWQDASWTIEKREGTWQLADDQQALDGSQVDEWLWKLRDVKLTRFVEDEPQSLSRYGLDPPNGTIQVWLTDQQQSKELLIGEAVGQGKARYGRMVGRPSIVELPETLLDLLVTKPESFAVQPISSQPVQ